MRAPEENDLCPCGSGKKYRKCCLTKDEEALERRRDEMSAIPRALQWLTERYPEVVRDAVRDDFYGDLEDAEVAALGKLPPKLQEMLHININEWIITDAVIDLEGVPTPVREILLGPGGPLLTARGRDWLQRLVEGWLSLYEVREVEPGKGLTLADLLRPHRPAVWVGERSASRSLLRWDVIGARLVRQDEGWVLSGALYPFIREETQDCREEIRQEMEGEDWNSDLARETLGAIIISYWLQSLIRERPFPKILDGATHDPVMLVTDHYRVLDWEILSTLLATQPNVHGDREEGWVRFTEADAGILRPQASLNVKGTESLEIFCHTLGMADEIRKWFDGVAGRVVKYKTRAIVDPRSPKALASILESHSPHIPPKIKSRFLSRVLQEYYDDWTEKPIPILGNLSPRQAVKTEAGREAVIELLKSYELKEARRSLEQGGEPFDFCFLWHRLGLTREAN